MKGSELDQAVVRMVGWLEGRAGKFLATRDAQRTALVRQQVLELRESFRPARRDVPICFLGNAGIGKSTLVNALVDPRVLVVPAGGVGPLTAQATLVRHSDEPYLLATYHGARRVNQLAFALQMYLRRVSAVTAVDGEELDEASRLEVMSALPESVSETAERDASEERIRSYISQARQMITGKQFGDDGVAEVSYLLQVLRACVGPVAQAMERARPADRPHVERLVQALRHESYRLPLSDRAAFLSEIRLHASGSLAPLIRSLEVGWHSPTLPPGMVLVDLPGIGIANDDFGSVTPEWIRRAEAVVLVVDRAGVTDASVEMLRTTGYLNSLLHRDVDSPQISPLLWTAVVKLDDVAKDERIAFRQEHPEVAVPAWGKFFDDACRRSEVLVRDQLAQLLPRGREDEDERTVNTRLLEHLRVFAVSAAQYRKLAEGDEEDRPLIRSIEESRIPVLSDALAELVARHHRALDDEVRRTLREARDSLERRLQAIVDELTADERQRSARAAQRGPFEALAAPLSIELAARSGALREKLRQTVPVLIAREVQVATEAAKKKLTEYLHPLQNKSWATLRATVRRGGVFVKDKEAGSRRNIDIPNELALRYEAELAPLWNRVVVAEIRRAFNDHAMDVRRILSKVVEWASAPERGLEPGAIQRYRSEVVTDLSQVAQIAERRTDKLREQIKQKLYRQVEVHVRTHCQKFVETKSDVGTGVGERTKRLLGELPEVLSPVVAELMRGYLLEVYETTIADLGEQVAKISDPIARAGSLLFAERGVTSVEEAARRDAELGVAQQLLVELSEICGQEER